MPVFRDPPTRQIALVAALALGLPATMTAQTAAAIPPAAVTKNDLRTPEPPRPSWAPSELESAVVDEGCPTAAIVQKTGERMQELMNNVSRYTATEAVTHVPLRRSGEWDKPVEVRFEYLAEVTHDGPGVLIMNELRNGGLAWTKFPGGVATLGIPAMVLVFHPMLVGGYRITCEGKQEWKGRTAWVLYFQQRSDMPPRLLDFVVNNKSWPVRIKGRAWIDTATYNPIHIETDLMDPVPQIALFRDHISIDYAPVRFAKENEEMWLPERAEAYMDFRHHRFHRIHSFSNFLLFSVDVDTKDKAPEAK